MKNVLEMYLESLETAMSFIKLSDAQEQINSITERKYRKLNQLILVAKQAEMKYQSNKWLSKEQLDEANKQVKKGEWGTQLYSFKLKDSTDNKKVKTYSYYTVYNIEQLEERA